MKQLDVGIHEGVPFEDYLKIDAISSGSLRSVHESPRKYKRERDAGGIDGDALRVGRAGHTAILEPDRFLHEYVMWKGKVRRGKEWDKFCDVHTEETILTRNQYETAIALRDATRNHPQAARLLGTSRKVELTLIWEHHQRGVLCKSRIDLLCGLGVVDIKTSRNPAPHSFAQSYARYGYDMQAAWYLDGWAALTGEAAPFYLIVPQSVEPFYVAVFQVPENEITDAAAKNEAALDTLLACREADVWPGPYEEQIETIRMPAWARTDDDVELTFGGEAIGV